MGTAHGGFNHEHHAPEGRRFAWWYSANGEKVRVKDMTDSHLLHTVVKLERDKMPLKLGKNSVFVIFPILRDEVKHRRLEDKLIEYEIRDAKACNDARRLVLAVAEKEKINGRTTHPEAKGNIP